LTLHRPCSGEPDSFVPRHLLGETFPNPNLGHDLVSQRWRNAFARPPIPVVLEAAAVLSDQGVNVVVVQSENVDDVTTQLRTGAGVNLTF
jgi:hypothetical protein